MHHEPGEQVIGVWDQQPSIARAVAPLVASMGYTTKVLTNLRNGGADDVDDDVGCLLGCVNPSHAGWDQVAEILEVGEHHCLPVILVTEPIRVETAVLAMRRGAFGVVETPVESDWLKELIREAMAERASFERLAAMRQALQTRRSLLSRREQEVLELLVAGLRTKEIAYRLGITTKTVETHRSRVFAKMQARSCVELLRLELMSRGILKDEVPRMV